MFVTGNFTRGDRVKIINDVQFQDQLGIFMGWDNQLAQVQLSSGIYWFEAYAIEYIESELAHE